MLTATYIANLVAFLCVKKSKIPFRNLQELANNKEYKLGVMKGGVEDSLIYSTVSVI